MDNNLPLVSIIVPVYNVAEYLDNCIKSITVQTYNNLEIILVNDGSTDNSPRICLEHQKNDSRIRVIDKNNGGLSEARNFGIDIAKGRFLSFVDSDDYIHPEMIEKMVSTMVTKNADIAVFGHFIVSGEDISEVRNNGSTYVYDTTEALSKILIDEEINSFAWDKLYKKELFTNLRYPVGRIFEDTAFTYKVFERAKKVVQTNDAYYYYIRRKNSLSNAINPKKPYHNFLAFFERYKFVTKRLPELTQVCSQKALQHGMSIIDNSIIDTDLKSSLYVEDVIGKISLMLDEVKLESLQSKSLKTKLRLYFNSPKIYTILYKVYDKLRG